MRRLALISLVAACAPDERDSVNERLPDGVFEPVPAADIVDASLVVDGETIWWAYTQRVDAFGQVRLAATTSGGRDRVPAQLVDPDSFSYMPDVALNGEHVVVAMQSGRDDAVRVRAFDAHGQALASAPEHIPVLPASEGSVTVIKLVARTTGSIDLLAGVANAPYEIAVAPLDGDYRGGVATTIGVPEAGQEVSHIFGLAAAEQSDGSLVVGWDRNWEQCTGPRPAKTLTTSVDAATVGAIQPVLDVPERGESNPALAVADESVYVAWVTDFYDSRARIALARYPDVGNVLVELGDAASYNRLPSLALAAPDRGALASIAADTNTISVVGFEDNGGAVLVGAPHIFAPVTLASVTWARVVHLEDERYLLAWIESDGGSFRLYSRVVDLAGESRARPAPSVPMAPAPRRHVARALPCSH